MILMIIIFNFISFIPIHEVQASLWTDAQSWLNLGAGDNPVASGLGSAKTEVSQLAGRLFGIGLGLAFIALAALGISYFFANKCDTCGGGGVSLVVERLDRWDSHGLASRYADVCHHRQGHTGKGEAEAFSSEYASR